MRTVEINLKSVEDLNIKVDSETQKVLEKTLALVDDVTKQRMIMELQLAAAQLKKETDEGVEKLTR